MAFAFDPERKAILLFGGDKKGKNQTRFYKKLIKVADYRFEKYITNLKSKKS
ncbi:MAG: type II toxin-antitoxin system RelE/ParE family toxin [Saprospiraceae bacterium]|nr:type II toxin-antitoxin system RelE/ParE family toxin [Saprospiraceae bacterium]MBP7922640.1 type II toxin-antitoxin system RelE/ParE family toxin [Saprospiraceae bacterium]MBP8097411.1 type II toxin-antitoxin system RelE/ParE family toxin [Saprospiraceae bacterium]MBP8944172.1 type II toxin-antitoxin system RelE/ParE family toxin [Saprospiraceae bacterium]MBP9747184.1 type II toxin-antitoxin system RelE/ParE family toxin [Saprospiraceae bacterium]